MPPDSSRFAPRALAYWPAFAAIVLADFVTKRIAEAQLTLHTPREVLGEWIRFTLTYNTGAAMNFSLGDFSRVGLSVIAVIMLVVLYRMYREAEAGDTWQALALGLVSGGALGNLVDRIRSVRGVVDFIDVGTSGWRFWTFNVADSAITVGAVFLVIILMRRPELRSEPPSEPPSEPQSEPPPAAPF